MKIRADTILLSASLLFCASVVSAGMYRWVDKNGTVHYTQTPPPGLQADTVRPAPPPNPGSGGLKKFSDNYEKAASERAKREGEASAKQEERDAECAHAQAAIDKLQLQPINRQAEQDDNGNLTRMTPEKHAELLAEAQKDKSKYCGAAQ